MKGGDPFLKRKASVFIFLIALAFVTITITATPICTTDSSSVDSNFDTYLLYGNCTTNGDGDPLPGGGIPTET